MDIKICKSARVCRACERDFVHEEPVNSVVRIQVNELLREDFCPNCWNAERKAEAYSHWSTKYYDPRVAEQEPAEAFSPLRQLFYEAVEAEDRVEQAKAFLAAQLLRRQKVFRQIKESDESDGEVKIVLFNDRIGNRLIEVRDPNFSYAELEQGRVLLMARLQELEAPEKAVAAEPATGPGPDTKDEAEPLNRTGDPEDDAAIEEDSGDEDSTDDGDDAEEDDEDEYDDDDDDDEDEYDDDDDEEDDDEEDDDEEDDEDEYDDDEDDEYDDEDEDEDELVEEEEEEEEEASAHVR